MSSSALRVPRSKFQVPSSAFRVPHSEFQVSAPRSDIFMINICHNLLGIRSCLFAVFFLFYLFV